ncbi:MAG: protein-tyrosine phosphatase [Limisphaerales bacterium]|jgi:protein-tyrosine phosphatase
MFTKLKNVFRSTPALRDFSVLEVDMHSHILPGIDDGARDINESLEMIESLINQGFKKLIATPHVMGDFYRNTPKTIGNALEQVRQAVKKEGLNIEIQAAAEYYIDDSFWSVIESGKALTLPGNYLLFELSFMNKPVNLEDTVWRIQSAGYTPVLAHPERYPYMYEDGNIDQYKKLVDRGVLLQVNLRSFAGGHSEISQKIARALVDEGLVDLLGTDMHRMMHLPDLKKIQTDRWYHKLLDSGSLLNSQLI